MNPARPIPLSDLALIVQSWPADRRKAVLEALEKANIDPELQDLIIDTMIDKGELRIAADDMPHTVMVLPTLDAAGDADSFSEDPQRGTATVLVVVVGGIVTLIALALWLSKGAL